ncbi:MAG: serine/threonine-protein kinase [Pirellulaceae bacterium]
MGFVDKFRSLFQSSTLDVEGRFESLREAVSGTMSQFHMARDRKTGEIFGLKILDIKKTDLFEGRFPGLKKPPEGEIASQFDHPLIVKTIAYGKTTRGEPYVLMEFLDGPGMNSLIIERSRKLEGKRGKLIQEMAEALNVVHKAGYIHRDICPRNFICAKDASSLKLIDFGLTVPAKREFMAPGNRTGTPNYMAPEIVRRRQTDHRVDLFSLGVTAYQLIAFELPWPGQDTSGKAAMVHDTRPPVHLAEAVPKVHPRLAEVIMSCLSVDPGQRPQTVEKFLQQVHGIDSEYR